MLPVQLLLQHQSIDAIRVIPRPSPDYAVSVALVKRQCRQVVNRGLQADPPCPAKFQAIFRSSQQQRAYAGTPPFRTHVNRDDVPARGAAMCDDKTTNARTCGVLRNQSECSPLPNISPQFRLRIGDPRRKAFLVHAPQFLEVLRPEVADGDGHAAIVKPVPCRCLGVRWLLLAGQRKCSLFRISPIRTGPVKKIYFLQPLPPCRGRNLGRTIGIRGLSEDVLWDAF